MITRTLYGLLWALALPLALMRLVWRSRVQPGYRARLGERLGRYGSIVAGPCIWVHAVSVGETRAAAPLVKELRDKHPGHRILLTHMTATGMATGEEIFGDSVLRAWMPYDVAFATRAFLRHFRPSVGIVMETEVWPRILHECRSAGMPILLANARLSERSARRYARWPALARWGFGNVTLAAAQAETDAQRLRALGVSDVRVVGNVKFDAAEPDAGLQALGKMFRAAFAGASPLIVAGSTREGEEAILLDALQAGAAGDARLLLVPRHPQRFDAVAALVATRGLAVARRSGGLESCAGARVIVGDSMGEVPAYYAAADVVVMGGSLLDFGSQNLIEACALGVPVVVGPSTYNFEEASRSAIAAGAAVRAGDAAEALALASAIARDGARKKAMGTAGREFVVTHQGAVRRLVALAEGLMQARPRAP